MVSARTGLLFDEHFLLHDTGVESRVMMRTGSFELAPEPHPSSLSITRRSKEFLDGAGLTAQMLLLSARPATEDELAAYHTRSYITGIRSSTGVGPLQFAWGEIDEETVLSPASFEAALYAAGGAM